jgi:tRNA threonylcarbamoyladenosine biosynthesis protein TsaB
MILCIETATTLCSVALCDENGIVSLRESHELKSHAASLTVLIDELLKQNGIRADDLQAVAVGKGPGSYTGLRIGVSVAKGIAYSSSLPLIAIDTTLSMFHGMKESAGELATDPENSLFCPMIDARRMEVYSAVYTYTGDIVSTIRAEIIDTNSFMNIPEEKRIIFFGDGAGKCKEVIKRKNIYFAGDFRISAAHMQHPVWEAFTEKRFEDVAYFEPFYLKDFIATIPRKSILG